MGRFGRSMVSAVLTTVLCACGSPSGSSAPDLQVSDASAIEASDAASGSASRDASALPAGHFDAETNAMTRDGGVGLDSGTRPESDSSTSIPPPVDGGDPSDAGAPHGGMDGGAPEPRSDGGVMDAMVDPTPHDAGEQEPIEGCASSFCWEVPQPFGLEVTDLWVSPREVAWLVGGTRDVVRVEDGQASFIRVPVQGVLKAVWGTSDDSVWVAGTDGAIARYDGHDWRVFDGRDFTPKPGSADTWEIRAIHGSGPNNVWFSGTPSDLLRWDGNAFRAVATLSAGSTRRDHALWVEAPDRVYAIDGTVIRYDGTRWTVMEVLLNEPGSIAGTRTTSVFSRPGADAWAGTSRGHVTRFWPVDTMWSWPKRSVVRAIRGDGAETWVVYADEVARTRGASYEVTPSPASPDDSLIDGEVVGDTLWLASRTGGLWRHDRKGVSREVVKSLGTLERVTGTSDTDLWLVGSTEVTHYDGHSFEPQGFAPFSTRLYDAFARARDDVWVVGRFGDQYLGQSESPLVRRFDGATWGTLPFPSGSAGRDTPTAVWARARDDAWVGSSKGRLLHFDGQQLVETANPLLTQVVSIWGSAADDVYASSASRLVHYDGKVWSTVTDAPPSFGGQLYGFGPRDVWIAGSESQYGSEEPPRNAWHFDGVTWSPVSGMPVVEAMGGVSSRDLFFFAYDSTWHYDGRKVTQVAMQGIPRIRDSFVSPQGTVWAVGRGLLRRGVRP